jgi:hypothetical protein
MTNQFTQTPRAAPKESLALLDNLIVLAPVTQVEELAKFLPSLPLKLPEGQRYFVQLNGGKLTIIGESTGVNRYELTREGQALQAEFVGGQIEFSGSILTRIKTGLRKVCLLLSPQKIPQDASFVLAGDHPVGLMKQALALLENPSLSKTQHTEALGLLRQIGDQYRRRGSQSQRATTRKVPTVTPGESASFSGGRSG